MMDDVASCERVSAITTAGARSSAAIRMEAPKAKRIARWRGAQICDRIKQLRSRQFFDRYDGRSVPPPRSAIEQHASARPNLPEQTRRRIHAAAWAKQCRIALIRKVLFGPISRAS